MVHTAGSSPDGRVPVHSALLGSIAVPSRNVISFPQGLPGFPEAHGFALLPAPHDGMFWLQSTEVPALAFFLVDPFQYFPGYHIDLTPDDLQRIGTSDPYEILVLSIVTLGEREGRGSTANLRAPLLLNLEARRAHQSIRPDEGFGVQAAIDLQAVLANAG